MDYPLGSFPRFGYQERWAQERRTRALENSAFTRKCKMIHNLKVEIAFFNWLIQIVNSMTPHNEKGEKTINSLRSKMEKIKAKLESGKRVHFKCFGRIFHTILGCTNSFPNFRNLDVNQLAIIAENIGKEQMGKQP